MAQGPSDTILVAIRITLRIRESEVRNTDPPDRRRFVLSECFSCLGIGVTPFEFVYDLGRLDSIGTTLFANFD